jgi:hypothetical protein
MKQKEVFVTSSVGTMSKIDLSRCKVVQEPLLTNQLVLFFRKNHFLVDSVDNVIGLFKAAGLNDLWISKYVRKEKAATDPGPKVMTVYNLSGTFKVFIYGCSISCAAFFAELVYRKFYESLSKSVRWEA